MRIVIIDDEDVICRGLSKIITSSQKDWTVAEVYNDPEEALEFCDWDRMDLLLADINMPNMDGLTLVDTLRERGYLTQVIFISGFAEFRYAQKAIQQKAVDYIIKPVGVPSLMNAIGKAETLYRQRQQQQRDETFIKTHIASIAKSFIYDVLFETKRFEEEEMRDTLALCGLTGMRFSLCNLVLHGNCEQLEQLIERYNTGGQAAYLYRGSQRVYTIVVCEEIETVPRIEAVIREISRSGIEGIFGETRIARDIRQLPDAYYDLMVRLRSKYRTEDESSVGDRPVAVEPDPQEYSMHVVRAIEYIREHYAEKISLAKLSEEIYVHPTYLSNLFKGQTGFTVVDYINHYRIEMAKELLKDSRSKIFWVAERVGFVNQRYFSQIFKKYTGSTPVQYKQDLFFLENGDNHEG